MARVKNGAVTKARHKKVLKAAKGYFGSKHRLYKSAKEQLIFACMTGSGIQRVDVCADGRIYCHNSGSSWQSLDNITFISGV